MPVRLGQKIIPKSELELSRRPSTTLPSQLARARWTDLSRKARAIPAGQLARNFRSRVFREDNARGRYRSLDRPSISPAFSEDRDPSRPSFSGLPAAQIAKT